MSYKFVQCTWGWIPSLSNVSVRFMLFLINGLVVHSFVSLNTTVLHYMKGKIIFPLPFDVLYWDPHNEREMNWRKTIRGLIYAMHSCILKRYLGKLSHFLKWCKFSSVQSLSQDQLFTTPWTGFPVHHQLPELAQTNVHWVSDAIQPSHPLSSPSPAVNLSQHQGFIKWVSSSHQVANVLEIQL